MTQDQPQTPEPNQPQPTEAPAGSSAESSAESSTNEIPLTDETLANALLGDVPPEESQLQSSDSRSEEPVASIEVSATEVSATADQGVAGTDQAIETPVQAPEVARSASPIPTPESLPESVSESKSPPASEPRSTSSNKVMALIRLVGQVWGIVLPIAVIVVRWLWQVLRVTLKWIGEAWKVILPRIRTLLPESWRKLPDWALTTVAVTLLVFVVWLTTQLLPGQAPVVARTGDRTPPALNAPAPEQPIAPIPDPALITNIQTQVAEVTDRYAEGLIQAVQANFQGNLLTVKVGNPWFNLDSVSQSQLANELLKRSHKLDFEALELTDPEGELLARNPVVGTKMVIYGRRRDEG